MEGGHPACQMGLLPAISGAVFSHFTQDLT